MYPPAHDWRDERKTSISSILLLIIFVAASAFIVVMTVERPWAHSTQAPVMDARQYADRGLGPLPPGGAAQVAGQP